MASELVDNSRVTVVCNAGKRVAMAQRFVEALKQRGLDANLAVTASHADGDHAAREAIESGAQIIVAAGGDGTVRSVLGAVAEADVVLGLLPLGTSNDLAMDLGVRSLRDAIDTVLGARARAWDLSTCSYQNARGETESSVFCSTAGAGGVARLLAMAQTPFGGAMKRALGNAVWPPLALASACVTRATPQTLRIDGVATRRALKVVEISKLRVIGGIPLTPDARGDSGMLHAWAVDSPSFLDSVRLLYQGLTGSMRHLENPQIDYFSREPSQNCMGAAHIRQIAVEDGDPMPVHVNGDCVGTTPAVFELVPQQFRVLAPPELAGEAVRARQERARGLRNSIPVPTSPRAARV